MLNLSETQFPHQKLSSRQLRAIESFLRSRHRDSPHTTLARLFLQPEPGADNLPAFTEGETEAQRG